jgi:hypothetical protein
MPTKWKGAAGQGMDATLACLKSGRTCQRPAYAEGDQGISSDMHSLVNFSAAKCSMVANAELVQYAVKHRSNSIQLQLFSFLTCYFCQWSAARVASTLAVGGLVARG